MRAKAPLRTAIGLGALVLLAGGGIRAAEPPPTDDLFCAAPPAATAPAPPASGNAERLLRIVVSALAVGGVAFVLASERSRGRGRGRASPRTIRWAPYLAGAGLGAVIVVAEVGFGRAVGVSGGIQAAARALAALGDQAGDASPSATAAPLWSVAIIAGVIAGGLVSRALRRDGPDRPARPVLPPRAARRARLSTWAVALLAGVLLQLGALVAGGCTSGLALSGGIVLAPAAFLFMLGMFAGGIPAAWLGSRR